MKKIIKGKILLKDIVIDEKLYPRVNYSWQTVYDYSESMKSGAKFPRIVVAKYKNMFILIDGRHRLEAYKQLSGAKKFNKLSLVVDVLVGLTKNKIYEESILRNITHGRPFSVQEKIKIAVRLKDLKYSQIKISNIVNIPVGKLSTLISRRLTNSITGDEIVLKKPFEHLYNDDELGDVSYIQKGFKGESQLSLINSVIILLETKTINKTDEKVIVGLKKLKKILTRYKIWNTK